MEYTQLGKTDMKVSRICLGCWGFVGDATWGTKDEAASIATIHAALDQGINFLDTAEMYGNGYSEELLSRALNGKRQDVILASKVSDMNLAPSDLRQACENSLRRLQTEYIDLYQIHWPSRTVPLADSLGTLKDLQAEGKIRAIGVSNFGPQDLDELLSLGRAETNQFSYSLLWRGIEYEVKPKCEANDIGILCYSPLVHGLLGGKFATADDVPAGRARTRLFAGGRPQARHGEPGCEDDVFAALAVLRKISETRKQSMSAVAVAWLLHQSGVTSVITGARQPEQIGQTAQAMAIKLSEDELAQLDQATAPIKAKMGHNLDMWQTESRIR